VIEGAPGQRRRFGARRASGDRMVVRTRLPCQWISSPL
jgi:hypothetical protein